MERDTQSQFKIGIQIVQDCFERQAKELNEEVERWKKKAQTQAQEIKSLRDELSSAYKAVEELKIELAETNEAKKTITDKYNALMDHANNLQNFKKSIIDMLEGDNLNQMLSQQQHQQQQQQPQNTMMTPTTVIPMRGLSTSQAQQQSYPGSHTKTRFDIPGDSNKPLKNFSIGASLEFSPAGDKREDEGMDNRVNKSNRLPRDSLLGIEQPQTAKTGSREYKYESDEEVNDADNNLLLQTLKLKKENRAHFAKKPLFLEVDSLLDDPRQPEATAAHQSQPQPQQRRRQYDDEDNALLMDRDFRAAMKPPRVGNITPTTNNLGSSLSTASAGRPPRSAASPAFTGNEISGSSTRTDPKHYRAGDELIESTRRNSFHATPSATSAAAIALRAMSPDDDLQQASLRRQQYGSSGSGNSNNAQQNTVPTYFDDSDTEFGDEYDHRQYDVESVASEQNNLGGTGGSAQSVAHSGNGNGNGADTSKYRAGDHDGFATPTTTTATEFNGDREHEEDEADTWDANELFAYTKRALEPKQYEEFARNIHVLNKGTQSVEATLDNIQRIFGSEHRRLFLRLERLIREAQNDGDPPEDNTGINQHQHQHQHRHQQHRSNTSASSSNAHHR